MVTVASQQERQGHKASVLPLRIANQKALLSLYNFTLLENILKFKDRLLADFRQEFIFMVKEDKLLARTAVHDSLDAADSAAHCRVLKSPLPPLTNEHR